MGGISGTAWFYHKFTMPGQQQWNVRWASPELRRPKAAVSTSVGWVTGGNIGAWTNGCRRVRLRKSELWIIATWKAAPIKAFRGSDLFPLQSNGRITKGACPWDIYSLRVADEMVE